MVVDSGPPHEKIFKSEVDAQKKVYVAAARVGGEAPSVRIREKMAALVAAQKAG